MTKLLKSSKGSKSSKGWKHRLKNSDSVVSDRCKRNKPAKSRAKLDSLKWDGMSNTFRSFKASLEGNLVHIGAGYLIKSVFLESNKQEGVEYLTSKELWILYREFSQRFQALC